MIDNPWLLAAAFALGGYVVGATPFGYLIGRLKGVDIRSAGSGNVGATNVGRVLGRPWGYLCFALDLAKGLVPVVAAWAVLRGRAGFPTPAQQGVWLAAGCGTILGHVFSVWLRFRGGKGVATSLGVVLAVWPFFTFAALAAAAIWLAVTLASRYVSLGSIAAAIAFVPLVLLFALLRGEGGVGRLWPLTAFAAAMAALIILRHRGNIRRLLAGTENRIGRPR